MTATFATSCCPRCGRRAHGQIAIPFPLSGGQFARVSVPLCGIDRQDADRIGLFIRSLPIDESKKLTS